MKRAPRFTTQIYSKAAPQHGPGFVTLMVPLRYESRILGCPVSVPRGFPSDFASFRIGDLHLGGRTDRPAVVHDSLYARGTEWKTVADLVFYEACRAEGLGRFRAGLRFLAVWASPTARKAWNAHRKGVTPATRFLKALNGVAEDTVTNHP